MAMRDWVVVCAARAAVVLGVASLVGCGSTARLPAVPRDLQDRAVVLGDPAHRTWGNDLNEAFLADLIQSVRREQEALAGASQLPKSHFLAISGGGQYGAFGAGLLCGWTAQGTRPEFKIVTGISTGALTAPFAFLGPQYDDRLREVYTTVSTKDIARRRGALSVLFEDAAADNAPLRRLLESYVDEDLMKAIAREHQRGRLLLIGTTNLDAGRGMIWNLGAIAASGQEGALELVHDILIASASIPAAFPPVMFDVEVDGVKYQEMHVDGGARAQLFLYPPSLNLSEQSRAHGMTREREAFIIRNAHLDPQWREIERKALPIAGRSVSMMIQTQGYGDLYRTFLETQRDGVAFRLASIPPSFEAQPAEDFDPVFMRALFDAGYELATREGGYPWVTDLTNLDE